MSDQRSDDRIPISEVLGGMKISPLETGATPVEAFVLIKLLDPEGDPQWSFRTTNRLNLEELLGAMVVQVEVLKRKLTSYWEDGDDD